MAKSIGNESTEIKIKARQLFEIFPRLFSHIDPKDILFFRIEKDSPIPIRILPVDDDPWQYIVPYKYIIIIYEEFDSLPVDIQMQALAHKLLCIPKDYQIRNVLKEPELVMHKEEQHILDWLKTHKFDMT